MDDYSIPPIAPTIPTYSETFEDKIADAHDERLSRAYFSKQWEGVQDLFEDKILAYMNIGSIEPNLPADEYKIEALVRARVAAELKEVLLQVHNAVEATEAKQRGK
jgi:hypothetical protein